MRDDLQAIANVLSAQGIEYAFVSGKIHVPLPNDFDSLVIEIWKDSEDSLTLLSGSFHTHGDLEAREHGLATREEGICHLIESIFNGKFKMVKRKNSDGVVENTIWDSFSLNCVDENEVYEIIPEI